MLIAGLSKKKKSTYWEDKRINVMVVQHSGIGEIARISYSEFYSVLFKIKF